MLFHNLYPATVYSYNASTRECRIEIEGITSGSEDKPIAEILNPVGDKGRHTELEIKAGDLVWIAFINGEPEYPIIMGYRNHDNGNSQGWRRYHHANIELNADGELLLKASSIKLESASLTISASYTHNGVNVGETHGHGTAR